MTGLSEEYVDVGGENGLFGVSVAAVAVVPLSVQRVTVC